MEQVSFHLDFIFPPNRPQNRSHILPGQNPAQVRIWARLNAFLNSIFGATLGPENTLIWASNHGHKSCKTAGHLGFPASQKEWTEIA
jgi:hypothetical protein